MCTALTTDGVLPALLPQLPMLQKRWRIILFGLVMQYVHGIFTQLAHRMHHPQEEPLHDVGFELTPVGANSAAHALLQPACGT